MTLGWCILDGDRQRGEAMTMALTITPPGRARIMTCPECKGAGRHRCIACHGEGRLLVRACPRCGDIGWGYVNGVDDRHGMACGISCGYQWTADDPGWRAQMLPPPKV
jgi:hypothetical protein